MTALHELTAAEQLRALRARELSSAELTDHYLDRIERHDTALGAFVTVIADDARASAADADRRRARGDDLPLLGLPLGIKDLQATAGIRTTFGCAAFEGFVPPEDSWTVGQVRRAGAVVVGKTNTPEFGATCYTENCVTEHPAVTPYDTARYASGSSGGSAAAVAAGLVPLAHASDGAGSIRTPAATCALVGVKPSRGLVSAAPASGFLATTTEGPLARTVADAALLLDVMAAPAPGDLYAAPAHGSFADAVQRGLDRPLRIAMWTDAGLDAEPHPDAVSAAEHTADALRALGHEIVEREIPARVDAATRRAFEVWFASTVGAATATLVPPDRHDALTPFTRHLVALTAVLSATDVLLAHAALARYASAFLAAFADVDAALIPVTATPPLPLGHFLDAGVEHVMDRMLAWSGHTPWANLTGQPAIAVPSMLTADGLPMGAQLVGQRGRDDVLLALAAGLEEAGGWHAAHPPCWND